MSEVCYKLFEEQYCESQGKMMVRIFEALLRRHPQVVLVAIEKFSCLSATDYTKDLEALRAATSAFQNKTTFLIEGQTVCIGTSIDMRQKKSFISRLFHLCGEDERQFQIIEQQHEPGNKQNPPDQKRMNPFRPAGVGYTLFGEHLFSTQAEMMCRVFERVFQKKPEMVDWAVSNLKCLSWTDYTACSKRGELPPYNFKNCRMIAVGNNRLCVGTNYGIKAKGTFLDRLIHQAGLPENVFQLDPVQPLLKPSYWQTEAVQAILQRLPQISGSDKRIGCISMPAGTGKTAVIGELIRSIFHESGQPWSVLILTNNASLSYQYQEHLKVLLGPSFAVERPAKTSELAVLVGAPGIVLTTTAQSLLNRARTGYRPFFNETEAEIFSASGHLLVILDEITVGFAGQISRDVHARFPNAAFFGFTADPSPSRYLLEVCGPVIFQYTYEEALQNGVLCPVCYENVQPVDDGSSESSQLYDTQSLLFSEKRVQQVSAFLIDREKSFERRVLVLCANLDEAVALYDFLKPSLSDKRLQLRNSSILPRRMEKPSPRPVSWDGLSFPGCIVLSCAVTTDFPLFDTVYLDRKVRNSYDMACILSVLMRRGEERQETGKLIDMFNGLSSIHRIFPPARFILQLQRDDPSPSLESYIDQIEDALESRQFERAQMILFQMREAFPAAGDAVLEQLAFLKPPADGNPALYWRQHTDSLAWYGDLWRLLRRETPQEPYPEELPPGPEAAPEESYPAAVSSGTPQARGARLESAVKELLRNLFSILEEENQDCMEELHIQGSGYQFGFDVAFTYRDAFGVQVRCAVECKNYQDRIIRLDQIAGKLVSAKSQRKRIDHWILIAPNSRVSNELWRLQAQWRESGEWYPILDIQLWTADQEVGELFSLFPKIYQQFYDTNPEDIFNGWSEERRRTILAKWRDKLSPVPYLSPNWMRYLREPRYLLTGQETDLDTIRRYDALYNCRAPIGLLDQNELPMDSTAECYFLQWLQLPDSTCALLLGDFGDGKTFFTYTLARRLAKEFLASPEQGFIPLRISLQRLGEQLSDPRDILNDRMREFSDGLQDWNEVQGRYQFLIILDGLDEMSQCMSDTAVLENLSILEALIRQFQGHKLLVTSRKMVIYSDRIRQRILTSLGNPEVLHLAPVTPRNRIAFLQQMADTPRRKRRLNQMRQTHDMLGLASKPLFLDMMRVQLDSNRVQRLDSAGIYLYYAKEVLRRKPQYLALREDTTHPDDIQKRLLELLEELALCLYRQETESISLADFRAQIGQNDLAEYLWDCADMAQEEDTDRRVGDRSLLKYDSRNSDKRCFCHRSMKEFFIAQGIVHQLLENEISVRALLWGPGLGYEILTFAGNLLQALDDRKKAVAARRLTSFAHERPAPADGRYSNLAVNSVNLLHYGGLGLPGQDWNGLHLDNVLLSGEDLSGKNFSRSSMRFAHLDNANLTGCDLRYCDFTGVQFEKTGQLCAFAVLPGGDGLLASYRDGKVRRWQFSDGSAHPLTQLERGKILRLFLQGSGREAALDTEQLQFWCRGQHTLTSAGYAPLSPGTTVLDVGCNMVLVRRQDTLLLFRLADSECLGRIEAPEVAMACLLWEAIVLLWSKERGLELLDMKDGTVLFQLDVEIESVSALAAHAASSVQGIAVQGSARGDIIIYDLIFDPASNRCRISRSGYASTDGVPVMQAAVDDGGVYISLPTGKIILYRNDDSRGLCAEDTFHLEIKCTGAKIDGVVPPEQHRALLHAQI